MRLRLGSYVFGVNSNLTEHALFGRFMIGRVADTIGVLNTIKGQKQQMFFADFDTSKLTDIFNDMSQLGIPYLLFKSEMVGQETHYFIISPFRYEPKEIRIMLAKLNHVDSKFAAVYMRDGVNAIRLIPKYNGNKTTRLISLIELIPTLDEPEQLAVRGMMMILQDKFPNISQLWDLEDGFKVRIDTTEPKDLTLREYETIRW